MGLFFALVEWVYATFYTTCTQNFHESKHLQNLQDFDKIPPVSFLNHQSLQCADLGVCVYKTKRQKNLSLILCISTKSRPFMTEFPFFFFFFPFFFSTGLQDSLVISLYYTLLSTVLVYLLSCLLYSLNWMQSWCNV